jgi:phage baseplate assembly protein gpV
MDNIIRDSSIWKTRASYLSSPETNNINMGIIINEKYSKEIDSILYSVEVYSGYRRSVLLCTQMVKSGDFYNYEEIKLRPNINRDTKNSNQSFATRLGEMVLVACISGSDTSGVIIGSIRHPGRKAKLISKDLAYISEYNGVETSIDKDGAYKLKFQGTPTNVKEAKDGSALPVAKYNEEISGSYLTFDNTGSFVLTDAAKEEPQVIKVDKKNGTTSITSGTVTLVIEKKTKKISIKCEDLDIESKKKTSLKTSDLSIEASKNIKIKGQKIAIGTGSNELLDILVNLIDQIGALTIISPNGPCTPVQGSATWSNILALKNKISTIKGSL